MKRGKYNTYSYEYVRSYFSNKGFSLLSKEYKSCKDKLIFSDKDGFLYSSTFDKFKNSQVSGSIKFHKSNPYSIQNLILYAKIHNYSSTCVSSEFIGAKSELTFQCKCGTLFKTTSSNFISGHKNRCDKCSGYVRHNYEEIKTSLNKLGFSLCVTKDEYTGVSNTKLHCMDSDGFHYLVTYNELMRKQSSLQHARVHKCNPYSIVNINTYLSNENIHVTCISDMYINKKEELVFICDRCGTKIKAKWANINRNDSISRSHVLCPNCDPKNESLHALVLKQVFLHEYPDTIVEDKSFRSNDTGKIRPTDIVNHSIKIAIEIQSQYHDYPDIKLKDNIKKEYWVNRGYSFYAIDIRDYTPLQMIQLFFPNITEIPDYVDYNYSNRINIKDVQGHLDNGEKVIDIANNLHIKPHLIYDAIYSNRLHYPKKYQSKSYSPVNQYDLNWNFIATYPSISAAGRDNDISPRNISSALLHKRNYSGGYYWKYVNNITESSETAGCVW